MKKLPLYLIVFVALGSSCGHKSEDEIHLIPAGFMGTVYILHNAPDGEPLKREGNARVYEIPIDGILRSQTDSNLGWFTPSGHRYYYVTPDGERQLLPVWDQTIHDTPENRADPTVGVYDPSNGFDGQEKCGDVETERYHVGTKSFILSPSYRVKDLGPYLREHPVCK